MRLIYRVFNQVFTVEEEFVNEGKIAFFI